MLNVHRARMLAASRAAAPGDDESRMLCAIVASVMSLMLLCGLLSLVPSPRAFGVTKTYVVIGAGAVMLALMLVAWLVAAGTAALDARWRRAPPAPVRLALRQMCACGLADAAVGALPAFPYEGTRRAAASEGGGEQPARGSVALCAVCLEDVRAGEMVRRLPACGHLFHVCCVDAWLRSHRTCPICRCELPSRNVAAAKADLAVASSQSPDALPSV